MKIFAGDTESAVLTDVIKYSRNGGWYLLRNWMILSFM